MRQRLLPHFGIDDKIVMTSMVIGQRGDHGRFSVTLCRFDATREDRPRLSLLFQNQDQQFLPSAKGFPPGLKPPVTDKETDIPLARGQESPAFEHLVREIPLV